MSLNSDKYRIAWGTPPPHSPIAIAADFHPSVPRGLLEQQQTALFAT